MINEIAPRVYTNEIINRVATPDDYAMIFDGNTVLLKGSNDIPHISDISAELDFSIDELEYLFSIDDDGYYLLRGKDAESINASDSELNFTSLEIFRTLKPEYKAFAITTAGQMYRFLEKHKFCGSCGGNMLKSTTERALICEGCGETIYPGISPAVAVAIINGDKILMARNSYGTFRRFSILAGYMEVGESLEDTVNREVMEEVGLKVKNIRYYKSQPWASSDTEMIGFFADLDGDETITCQESEIAEAGWFSREELPDELPQISLSYEMIEQFRQGTYPR